MAERANISPSVIIWARETAKISVEEAARLMAVKVEKINEWESGNAKPTVNQAIKLAKKYKRPFAIFFLPEPPKDFHPLQDFRKADSIDLTTATTFIIREIQQKQSWISQTMQENSEEKLSFVGKFNENDDPEVIANDIRLTLGIDYQKYGSNPLKYWISKAEEQGIFVSRASFIHTKMKIDKDEIQGFAIADAFAPFIFVNSSDYPAPQLFTLAHELAHIWIAKTGISNYIEPELKELSKFHPVELLCNSIAAIALMPTDIMNRIPDRTFQSISNVYRVAKIIGVSSFALIYRARNLDMISTDKYQLLKREASKKYEEFLVKEILRKKKQKKSEGGPSPYLLKLNRNGKLFTQIVIDGYKGGNIEPNLASNLLNTKSNKFNKLEARINA